MDRIKRLTHQEVAEQVLQIYMKSLQDHKSLKSILSEFCVLDYFGKFFYKQDKVASHLILNLHGSNYELSSLSVNDVPCFVPCEPLCKAQEKTEEELGVGLISSPKLIFPSLVFSTPIRMSSQARKRTASESSVENYNGNKAQETNNINDGQCSSSEKSGADVMLPYVPISPQTLQSPFPDDMRYLTACGTIRYPKRILPTMDPKRIKYQSSVRLRDRYCKLFIGFECDEHVIGVTNCKIWTIKYSVSSRVTPRNLLKSFNEVEVN